MSIRRPRTATALRLRAAIEQLEIRRLLSAVAQWDGAPDGGGVSPDANWTTAVNWEGDVAPSAGADVFFPVSGVNRGTVNDFPDNTTFNSITFQAPNYFVFETATGDNTIQLSDGIFSTIPTAVIGDTAPQFHPGITLLNPQTFLASGARNLILNGPIDLNGSDLAFDISNINVFANAAISGTGGISKSGGGTLTLGVANSYTGLTTISAGFLRAANNGSLGTSGAVGEVQSLTITGGSAGSYTISFGGFTTNALPALSTDQDVENALNALPSIGGAGASVDVTKPLSNVLNIAFGGSLSQANVAEITATGSGGTVATPGTVTQGNPADFAQGTVIQNGGTLTLSTNVKIPEAISAIGNGELGLGGALVNQGDTTTYSGPLKLTGATTIKTNIAGGNLVVDGPITLDFGLTVDGPGKTRLNGKATGVGGITKNGAGTLFIGNSTNAFSGSTGVNAGTLGGTGKVAGLNVASGGTLSPGFSPGKFTTSGNVTLNSSSTFAVEINGPTAGSEYDQLDAGAATVSLGNATLNVTKDSGFTPASGSTFVIVFADGGVSGAFNGIANHDTITAGGTTFTVNYLSDKVTLTVGPAAFTWDGAPDGGGSSPDANWTTAANWVGDLAPTAGSDLVFGAANAVQRHNTNNFPSGTVFNSIAFNDIDYIVGETALGANPIQLNAGFSSSVSGNVINDNGPLFHPGITLLGAQSFTSTGNLSAILDGDINLNGNTLTVDDAAVNFFLTGDISGIGGITKTSSGTLVLSGQNSYTGLTQIVGGRIQANSDTALGASGAVDEVQSVSLGGNAGGSFTLTFNGKTTNSLSATATAQTVEDELNALASIGGVDGSVDVSLASNVYSVTFGGALSQHDVPQITATPAGGATAVTGTIINGVAADSPHATLINPGAALVLVGGVKIPEAISIQGTGVAGAGAIASVVGDNTLLGPIKLTAGATVSNIASGKTLAFTNAINLQNFTLTIGGIANIMMRGQISGSGNLSKGGTGTLFIANDANDFTGSTGVAQGTLGGIGRVAALNVGGGTLAPGFSPGAFASGDLDLTNGSLNVELNGTSPGTQYDQVNVTGSLDVSGATLNVDVGFTPAPATVFTILTASFGVGGAFIGLPQGTSFDADGTTFVIHYNSNDVTLTAQGAAAALDFGDAPNSYGTTLASNGPRHGAVGVFLGATRDTEADGQPNATATGDDASGVDDEDGITFLDPIIPGSDFHVKVNVSTPVVGTAGFLNSFFDWNADGDFTDSGELSGQNTVLFVGDTELTFTAPSNAVVGNSFARFRLTSTAIDIADNTPTGARADGEVEDYAITVELQKYDFGDAPNTYLTTLASDGPRHAIKGVLLGTTRDDEADGQPSAAATGDDLAGSDDEDGITLLDPIVPGADFRIRVKVTNPSGTSGGFINPFFDWNADGDFFDTGELLLANTAVSTGDTELTFTAPSNAVPGNTFARFRLTSTSVSNPLPIGEQADGEVEDHQITIVPLLDYGDAPDTYGTKLASNGARHILSGVFLGSTRDADSDGQPGIDADGDDNNGTDDEDGVTIPALTRGGSAQITVVASAAGFLNAYFDWNADGDFADSGETVFSGTALSAGSNSLTVNVPSNAVIGTYYARFRVTDAANTDGPTGQEPSGEVEDYKINVAAPAPGSISGTKFNDLDGDGVKDAGEGGVGSVTIELQNTSGQVITTTTTASDGAYTFTSVPAGTYRVREHVPTDSVQTTANPPDTAVVAGQGVTGVDFGNFKKFSISGRKFNDADNNGNDNGGAEAGIGGVTIYLDLDGSGGFSGGDVSTTTAPSTGAYSFTGLGPRTAGYIVREITPLGTNQTAPAGGFYLVSAASGTNVTGRDFGNFTPPSPPPATGSISGQKWKDTDKDGYKDANESWLGGVTINLDKDANGSIEATTTTDSNGAYTFSGLIAGKYRVREVVPLGYKQTSSNPADITLSAGQNVTGVNFGNAYDKPTFTIDDVTAYEGNSGYTYFTFTITRWGDLSKSASVYYSTSSGTASSSSDYTSVASTKLSFNANQATKTITIKVKGDTKVEPAETFFVKLSNAASGNTITDSSGTGTIQNDDTPTSPPPPPPPGTTNSAFTGVDPCDSSKTALFIYGTDNNDLLNAIRSGSNVAVLINQQLKGTFAVTGHIYVYALKGNDLINIDPNLLIEAYVFCGDGNDTAQGGGGNDVLLGEAGNDALFGNGGRDILIAGTGSDNFNGGLDDDILITGRTAYDSNIPALCAIQKEWVRTDQNYSQRQAHIRNGGGLNGAYAFNSANVIDDGVADTAYGSGGIDLFFGRSSQDKGPDYSSGLGEILYGT